MDTSISGMGPSPAEQSPARRLHHTPAQATAFAPGDTPGITALDLGRTVPHLGRSSAASGGRASTPESPFQCFPAATPPLAVSPYAT